MSFVRRFSSMPTSEVITQIEGVVIVDTPSPTNVAGTSTGVVGMVGEFADMRYAVQVDGSGNVTTKTQPVAVTVGTDLLSKVGGFDSTIGDFGNADGNGYAAAVNKPWAQLVVAPVNLASPKAVRLWRELPTNQSNLVAQPVVPMQAATVAAGTEFKSGANRVKLGTAVAFTADTALASGVDGVQTAEGPLATVTFTSATGDFINKGIRVGDALVVGVIGGTGDPGTYRVAAVTNATTLEVESLTGANVTWAGATALAYRVHPASTFDSGANTLVAANGGYTLPARPLDATISAATSLAPSVAAPAGTALAWYPLSGLAMRTMPSDSLVYNANVQAPNAANHSSLNTLYTNALAAFLADADPSADISIVFSARSSPEIMAALKTHAITASATGRGRVAVIAPPLSVQSLDTAIGSGSTGVGYNRDERVIYCWPGVKQGLSEAQNTSIELASGAYASDGIIDSRADCFMASILSNLSSERNPGQSAAPVPTCLSNIKGFQSGSIPALSMNEYMTFRAQGVAALRQDRSSGWQFQSGITSSMTTGQKNINRRRMADEVQDSLAAIYEKFSKLPLTTALKDQIDSETVAYLTSLQSPNNPAAQRIEGFLMDSKSGNTPALNAQGIYVVIVKVRMLGTADDIVIQSEVGPTVVVTAA